MLLNYNLFNLYWARPGREMRICIQARSPIILLSRQTWDCFAVHWQVVSGHPRHGVRFRQDGEQPLSVLDPWTCLEGRSWLDTWYNLFFNGHVLMNRILYATCRSSNKTRTVPLLGSGHYHGCWADGRLCFAGNVGVWRLSQFMVNGWEILL